MKLTRELLREYFKQALQYGSQMNINVTISETQGSQTTTQVTLRDVADYVDALEARMVRLAEMVAEKK